MSEHPPYWPSKSSFFLSFFFFCPQVRSGAPGMAFQRCDENSKAKDIAAKASNKKIKINKKSLKCGFSNESRGRVGALYRMGIVLKVNTLNVTEDCEPNLF